jgi:hypothetical protein
MKRDMDLARKILMEVENNPEPFKWSPRLNMEGYSDKEIAYHVKLLSEAGLIEAKIHPSNAAVYMIKSLTWNGHEFLDASRDESRWVKAKSIILNKGGSLTFEILKQVLMEIMRGSIFP